MNPWHPNAFVESIFVNRVLFDSLTKPGKDLNPAPDLATSWAAAADGLSWTFNLQPNAKWSDGQAITADDVLFTFNDIVLKKELGATGAGNFSAVQNVEAVEPDDGQVQSVAAIQRAAFVPGLQRRHPAQTRF